MSCHVASGRLSRQAAEGRRVAPAGSGGVCGEARQQVQREAAVIVPDELFIAPGLSNSGVMASLIPDQLMGNEI